MLLTGMFHLLEIGNQLMEILNKYILKCMTDLESSWKCVLNIKYLYKQDYTRDPVILHKIKYKKIFSVEQIWKSAQ